MKKSWLSIKYLYDYSKSLLISINQSINQSIIDFLKDFYDENKKESPNFSYAYITGSLDWPKSLIGDLLGERKSLSLRRALELSKWMELDFIDEEHIVLLCLKDSSTDLVKDHFMNKVERDPEVVFPDIEEGTSHLSHIYAFVFAYISWKKGEVEIDQMVYDLSLTSEINREICIDSIEVLIRDGDIERAEHGFNILKNREDAIFQGNAEDVLIKHINTHKSYANTFKSFLDNMNGPCTFSTSSIEISEEKYLEAVEKVSKLSSWINKISDETKKTNKETMLFQFGYQFFPLIKKKKS